MDFKRLGWETEEDAARLVEALAAVAPASMTAPTGAQSMTLSICATLVSLVSRNSDKMSKRDVVLIGFFMVQNC